MYVSVVFETLVTEQFLHYFRVVPVRSEERAVRVAKSVKPLQLNPQLLRRGFDVVLHNPTHPNCCFPFNFVEANT